jgi:dynein heavy chain
LLIENVEYDFDPILENILCRTVTKKGNHQFIKINEKEINFNQNFRIFLTTKLQNPHYMPDLLI